MQSRSDSRSKRPPPLPTKKPSLSQKQQQHHFTELPPNARCTGHEKPQQHAQHSSHVIHQGWQSAGASSVTIPVDPAETHLPLSGSARGRNVVAELTNLMEQRIASSTQKSDYGSIAASSHASTTRSKRSGRSHQSAAAAQAQLEALDELTARGEIESRSERNLFKMTGQIPPSPCCGDLNDNEVYIKVVDLRSQCRAVNEDEQPAQDEAPKSPKKKRFQNIRNAFSKSSGTTGSSSSTDPSSTMPFKAAQVLGAAERRPQAVQALPIKPALPPMPELSWPLPSATAMTVPNIVNPDIYADQDDDGSPQHTRTYGRHYSPTKGSLNKPSSDARHHASVLNVNESPESIPPTPPDKDTPPYPRTGSPLRRVGPALDLRKSYEADIEGNTLVEIPDVSSSALSTPDILPESVLDSPSKFIPYKAQTYQDLTGELPPREYFRRRVSLNKTKGELLLTQFPARDDSLNRTETGEKRSDSSTNMKDKRGDFPKQMELKRSVLPKGKRTAQTEGKHGAADGSRSAPHEGNRLKRPQLPPLATKSDEGPSSFREQKSFSPLKPRFYSPKQPPALGFHNGETPSKNTDKDRLLYILPSDPLSPQHSPDNSRTGFIPMIFQGDPRDIDPGSPTALELERQQKLAREKDMQPDTTITTRVMQELRINDQSDALPQSQGHRGHPLADESCSRLTDMLHTVSPIRSQSHGDFRPHCPSAVPSPLHKAPVPIHTARPPMPMNGSFGPLPHPHPLSPRSIDDHFYMTNEHLDVVGKTTWDLLESFHKQRKNSSKEKYDDLTELINKRFDQVKLELDAFREDATYVREGMGRINGIAAQQDRVHATLDSLKDSIKEVILSTLAEQSAKTVMVEAEMKEMKQMIQALQKACEQRATEDKASQQYSVSGQYNTPSKGYSQGYAGNHGSGCDLGNVHDNRNMMAPMDSQGDNRLGYDSGHQWAVRAGYFGRNNKEDRPAYPTNPYHYNGGYSGSYSFGGYSPGSPEQNYPFNNNHGQAK